MKKSVFYVLCINVLLALFPVFEARACETTYLTISGNLDGSSALANLAQIPDMENHPSYAQVADQAVFSMFVEIFDSLGASHSVTIYFYHTWPRLWTLRAVVDGADVVGGTAGEPASAGPDVGLVFTPEGLRQSLGNPDAILTPVWAGGAASASIRLVYDLTQYFSTSNITAVSQDGGAGACSPRSRLDYDGDGIDDMAVWRRSLGMWAILKSSTGNTEFIWKQWGLPGDCPLAGDYTGDGKADLAVWRAVNGTWYICKSENNFDCATSTAVQWGLPGDRPIVGDFDHDGIMDPAVWRPEFGLFIYKSSKTNDAVMRQWGLPDDIPLSSGSNR